MLAMGGKHSAEVRAAKTRFCHQRRGLMVGALDCSTSCCLMVLHTQHLEADFGMHRSSTRYISQELTCELEMFLTSVRN